LALTVDGFLTQLAENKPEWCDLEGLKYILEMADAEAVEVLGVKRRTMQRMWRDAREWLFDHMESRRGKQSPG
jgi:hypothetical protein